MKKILVTGSNGYIGSVLTDYLSSSGYDVVGYDANFFKDSLLYPVKNSVVSYFRDARTITETDLENIDAVVHLAGISNDPLGKLEGEKIYDPTRAYSFHIAKLCKKMDVKFIFASSCSVYGIGQDQYLNEESETSPQTLYSLNKLQIENDLSAISDSTFCPIALRFATVFGPSPRLRFDLVINMLTGMAVSSGAIVLNSNGLAWRPNLHILDACQAIKCAIELQNNDGLLVLNVGSEENNMSIIDIARTIQSAVSGCDIKYLTENPELDKEGLIRDRKVKDGLDTRTYKVSFEKIKEYMPNFRSQWSVNEGIKDMVALFRDLPLSRDSFKTRGFYRLQQLEYLYEAGYLSDELIWIKTQN